MIRQAWLWYEPNPSSPYFVEVLLELADGTLSGLTYNGMLVFEGQTYLAGRVSYNLKELKDAGGSSWVKFL